MLGRIVERRVSIVSDESVCCQLEAHAVAVKCQRYDGPRRIYEALGQYACPGKANHQRRLKGNHQISDRGYAVGCEHCWLSRYEISTCT